MPTLAPPAIDVEVLLDVSMVTAGTVERMKGWLPSS